MGEFQEKMSVAINGERMTILVFKNAKKLRCVVSYMLHETP